MLARIPLDVPLHTPRRARASHPHLLRAPVDRAAGVCLVLEDPRDRHRVPLVSTEGRHSLGVEFRRDAVAALARIEVLFAYDVANGDFIAEYALDDANSDPHGIWSDGVTVWISDHGAKRLFAYRLPVPPGEPQEEVAALERASDEDFEEPGRVGNNSPRGIWSDGDVMYVADANDDKVYTYNIPDAIDARLASLTLEAFEIGAFDPARRAYEGVACDGVMQTTVVAQAVQDGASVDIEPTDADTEANGHQVALVGVDEIVVIVTSADGSRERVYRVAVSMPGPSASCLRGAVGVGFSLVVFEGGSVDD
ncbi:MAG: cadherin-like beta sandwich domain-containing protein, partial [Gammaproteobacteria bacterium]|nr:cadherin-like beta sandwich domain-containing protein [Gammaproteobacteria bacterium]